MPDAESVEQINGEMLLTFSERTNNFHYSQRFSLGGEAGLSVACGDFFEFSSRF